MVHRRRELTFRSADSSNARRSVRFGVAVTLSSRPQREEYRQQPWSGSTGCEVYFEANFTVMSVDAQRLTIVPNRLSHFGLSTEMLRCFSP